MDPLEEVKEVRKLLEENPDISRISPDGERLYVMVEGEVLYITGMPWNDMTEEQINSRLELARVLFETTKEADSNKDAQ